MELCSVSGKFDSGKSGVCMVPINCFFNMHWWELGSCNRSGRVFQICVLTSALSPPCKPITCSSFPLDFVTVLAGEGLFLLWKPLENLKTYFKWIAFTQELMVRSEIFPLRVLSVCIVPSLKLSITSQAVLSKMLFNKLGQIQLLKLLLWWQGTKLVLMLMNSPKRHSQHIIKEQPPVTHGPTVTTKLVRTSSPFNVWSFLCHFPCLFF